MKIRSLLPAILIIFIAAISIIPVFAAENNAGAPDVETIIRHIDQLYRSKNSSSTVEMEIRTPRWKRTLSMDIWTVGMKKTFVRILAPKKERGLGTLRIDTEMWNYLPKANKIIKIPPSMMMSSWMGSDFSNDDLVKESSLLEDYVFKLVTPEDADGSLWYVELVPREGRPIVWGKIIAAVRKEDYIPVWHRYFDEKDNLMRVLLFKEVTRFGGREIPAVLEMLPLTREGYKTVIRYRSITFDTDIDENVFTLRNLRAVQ